VSARAKVEQAARSARVAVSRVGRMRKIDRDGPRVTVLAAGKPVKLARAGYDHFT
jgi:hypothetical protein